MPLLDDDEPTATMESAPADEHDAPTTTTAPPGNDDAKNVAQAGANCKRTSGAARRRNRRARRVEQEQEQEQDRARSRSGAWRRALPSKMPRSSGNLWQLRLITLDYG